MVDVEFDRAVFFTPFAVDFCKVRLHGAFGFCEQKVKPIDVDVQTIGVNAIFGYVTEWGSGHGTGRIVAAEMKPTFGRRGGSKT